MTTVRWEASMPSVTCSAVEADPNPLGPGRPVTSLKSPMLSSPTTKYEQHKRRRTETRGGREGRARVAMRAREETGGGRG